MRIQSAALCAILTATVLSACNGVGELDANNPMSARTKGALIPYEIDALIYQGTGTAYGGAEALAEIMNAQGLSYRIADSAELDGMTPEQLQRFGVIVWPGGYAGQMSGSLDASTREKIRAAVVENGVSFVGICAGAFIAVSPDTSWGFSIVDQPTLPYYHLEERGVPDAMVSVRFADGSNRDLVWWGGPKLPEFPRGVVARYADTGEPAIAQTWAGRGLVVLSGPHPEAPADWRTKLGLRDSDGMDMEIAWQMINAALTRTPLVSN